MLVLLTSPEAKCERVGVMGSKVGVKLLKACLFITFRFLNRVNTSPFHKINLFKNIFKGKGHRAAMYSWAGCALLKKEGAFFQLADRHVVAIGSSLPPAMPIL